MTYQNPGIYIKLNNSEEIKQISFSNLKPWKDFADTYMVEDIDWIDISAKEANTNKEVMFRFVGKELLGLEFCYMTGSIWGAQSMNFVAVYVPQIDEKYRILINERHQIVFKNNFNKTRKNLFSLKSKANVK